MDEVLKSNNGTKVCLRPDAMLVGEGRLAAEANLIFDEGSKPWF